jgi:cytosine/adenosine deaminase-related metal-dependent hydrolase
MPGCRLAARWVIPVEGRPIEQGAVLIAADGRVIAVGSDAAVPRPEGVPADEFADGILLPGLINTHTHLELTGLDVLADAEFARWIRRVRELKAERTPEQFLAAARRGLADCFASGVTTVADTGDSGAVVQALAEAGGSGIVYQEVFGPHPAQAAESLGGLEQRIKAGARHAGGRVRLGASPHAPYTVSGRLYADTATWARAHGLPLAVHLAESPAESEFLTRGAGAFAAAWGARGIPLPEPLGRTPVEWLDDHGVLGPDTLCIHVVQAGPSDLDRLAACGAAVAHCPLSNETHGHGAAPLGAMLERGIRVGLGTDSVMSVGSLDLLAEARAARRLAALDAEVALELCTLGGARALGLAGEIGSLRPGKWGDCVAIHAPAKTEGRNPVEQVLASGLGDVLATYLGGRDVYRADRRS